MPTEITVPFQKVFATNGRRHCKGTDEGGYCDGDRIKIPLFNISTTSSKIDAINYFLWQKVGGDWVVAFAVYDREDRDIFRKVLGLTSSSFTKDFSFQRPLKNSRIIPIFRNTWFHNGYLYLEVPE